MRVLFYLPVVTEWWFDNIVSHVIRVAARDAEVHVAVPPLWRATGIGERQLRELADLPDLHWHILGGEGHESLRSHPAHPDAVVDFVRGIAPDYTFCRSADVATPMRFPGQVRFLMEASMLPHSTSRWIYLQSAGLYDHGLMPALSDAQRERLDLGVAPAWKALSAGGTRSAAERAAYLAKLDLPADRKVIALPLDYEGEENFFYSTHRVTLPNAPYLAELAGEMGEDCVLALTKHPIERGLRFQHVVEVANHLPPGRVYFIDTPGPSGNALLSLAQYADGVIVRDSKAFASAALFGKPILRQSRFSSGEWMHAYGDARSFFADVRAGTARAASQADARSWFAFHHANQVFAADDPTLTLAELVDRVEQPINEARWDKGLALLASRPLPALA